MEEGTEFIWSLLSLEKQQLELDVEQQIGSK